MSYAEIDMLHLNWKSLTQTMNGFKPWTSDLLKIIPKLFLVKLSPLFKFEQLCTCTDSWRVKGKIRSVY